MPVLSCVANAQPRVAQVRFRSRESIWRVFDLNRPFFIRPITSTFIFGRDKDRIETQNK